MNEDIIGITSTHAQVTNLERVQYIRQRGNGDYDVGLGPAGRGGTDMHVHKDFGSKLSTGDYVLVISVDRAVQLIVGPLERENLFTFDHNLRKTFDENLADKVR